jgi:DNA-binding response OmpR family regulator
LVEDAEMADPFDRRPQLARILVVDDEPGWLRVLERALAPEGYVVTAASRGDEAIAAARIDPPSLIILDAMLPDMTGVDVCRQIRREESGRKVPIIMLTVVSDPSAKIAALELGADDYVTKPFDVDELRARVRARLRDQTHPGALVTAGALVVDPIRREATVYGRQLVLTRRELDLLHLLARNAGRLVDRGAVAQKVWNGTCDPQSNVIEVYVARLRRKLRQAGYPSRIRTRWSVGYLLEPEDDSRVGSDSD